MAGPDATPSGGDVEDGTPRLHAIDAPVRASVGTDMHNFPFLMDIAALRAVANTRRVLDLDAIADAFAADSGMQASDDDAHLDAPSEDAMDETRVDNVDEFGCELRRRLSELGSRTAETRDISNTRDAITVLVETPPTTSSVRSWATSLADNLRSIPSHVSNGQMDDIADGIVRDSGALCDALDRCLRLAVEKSSCALDPISSRLNDNHEWIRNHSELIGVHCTSAPRCPVCLVRQVDAFVDPCGHTFCNVCIARCSDRTCCICKGSVRAKRQLFWCG